MICAVETWKYIYSLILVLNLGGKSLPNLIKQSFSYLTCLHSIKRDFAHESLSNVNIYV